MVFILYLIGWVLATWLTHGDLPPTYYIVLAILSAGQIIASTIEDK